MKPLKALATAVLAALPVLSHAQERCQDTANPFVDPDREQTAEMVHRVYVDPVYATDRNFTGEPLDGYQAEKVWIHPDALTVLQKDTPGLQMRIEKALIAKNWSQAQAKEESTRYFYLIKDAYRPFRATTDMNQWRNKVNSDSDPSNDVGPGWIAGSISNHNRGYTADRTLVRKMENGSLREVWMGSTFDEFNKASYLKNKDSSTILPGRPYEPKDDHLAYGGSYYMVRDLDTGVLRSVLAAAPGSDYWMEWWHTTMQSGGNCYDWPIQ